MEKIATKVTDFLTSEEKLDKSSKEYLATKYGIWLILEEGSKFLAYMVIFALLGKFVDFIFAGLVLVPLRMIIGGYHSKGYWSCFFLTFGSFFAAIYIGSYVPINVFVKVAIFIVGFVAVIFLAPVDNPNMPIRKPELRKKKWRNSVILFGLWGIGAVLVDHYLANITILLLAVQVLTLPAGIVSNKIHARKLAEMPVTE